MSKRQQARNERELHDLLRVPGNNKCADCGASNPGWASWNLGIFVCMRCASLHRKLGTHISKVKSLSMDTWNAEQVEVSTKLYIHFNIGSEVTKGQNMKQNGNTAVNKVYNPKNRKPDMPLDADEIDSAMERFIRKKYQDRSLLQDSTRLHPQIRNEGSPPVPPKSPELSPAPSVPSKKGRFFGFGLRASSSAYPLSKHDKKKLPPEPRVESAFTISSDGYGSVSRMSDAHAPMSDTELQRKLVQLRDMGFSDTERNTNMLRRLNGNVERTVEALVQLGPSIPKRGSNIKATPEPTGASRTEVEPAKSAPRSASTNPFDQTTDGQGFGISMTPQQPQGTGRSNNPFDQPIRSQTDSGLITSFQGLQVSQPANQPLFPNSTGGYPIQQPPAINPRLQSMTPPISMMSQQYGYAASPSALGGNTNPFFQSIQPQATGTNPFFSQHQQPQQPQQQPFQQPQQQQMPNPTMSNPFMNANNTAQQSNAVTPSYNPFGLPPSQQSPPHSSQGQLYQPTAPAGFYNSASAPASATTAFPPSNPFQQQSQQQFETQQSPQFLDFQYGQPQAPQQQQQAAQQPSNPYQMPTNPYASFNQPQFMQQPLQPPQPTSLMPQQTGRVDKNSILALYNYPQLAPSKPQGLSSIPEPSNESASPQPGTANIAGKRSATMPISMSSMHSAGGAGNVGPNRNPFFQNNTSPPEQPTPAASTQGIMARHISQESVNISNLESGRHSPDAFANLSARYVR